MEHTKLQISLSYVPGYPMVSRLDPDRRRLYTEIVIPRMPRRLPRLLKDPRHSAMISNKNFEYNPQRSAVCVKLESMILKLALGIVLHWQTSNNQKNMALITYLPQ